jgi:hypothetical protein
MKTKHDPRGSRAFKLFAALAVCLSSSACWAADYYVVPGGAGNRNGTSWTNALGDVQAAIDACAVSGGGTVKIAAGTYKPMTQPNLVPSGVPVPSPAPDSTFNHFSLRNNVKVWGGYKQSPESRNPQLYPTILSGDLAGKDMDLDGDGFMDNIDDNCRVFFHPSWVSVDSTAQLDGVIISGGCGRDNVYYPNGGGLNGGGMFNAAGISPTISNCVFRDNFSEGNGGAFYKEGTYSNPAAPVLDRCTFVANKANSGGAVALWAASSSSAVNCTFVANAASTEGGAVYTNGSNGSSSIAFMNCTFVNNRAESFGGGFLAYATVKNCILWGNSCNATSNPQLTADAVSNSIVQGSYTGTGNLDKDPLLLPLNNYGGNMTTMALRGDSPAINSGNSTGAPIVDERGYSRVAQPDIGAYEYRSGQRLYVKPGGAGNGTTSWANATGNLTAAIASAQASSSQTAEIWVAEGTYTLASYSINSTISLRNNVSVYGGFSGNETMLGQRDIATHPAILSADINGDDADSDGDGIPDAVTMYNNADYVCSNSAPLLPSAMLDGFILSGAKGAAIRNFSNGSASPSSPTIANCTFRFNAGSSVQNEYYSAPKILNCTFHHNANPSTVITNIGNSSPSVINCTFSSSSSQTAAKIIDNSTQGSPKFFNCTFAVGASQVAIYNNTGSATMIRNCIIRGNTNNSGITNDSTSAVVSHCVIQGDGSADPLLMPLGSYGGSTLTMPVSFGSSAIGNGFELGSGGADAPYADQRGFTRDAKPDIGACEWQEKFAIILTNDRTDRYAIGTSAILNVVSESRDLSGVVWQWYRGAVGDTNSPISSATQPFFGTPPLKEDATYWVRGSFSGATLDAGVALKTYSPHVIHVTTTGDDAYDGSTWALAKRNLKSVMSSSKSGDHIWVASGTYTFSSNETISLRNGVSVYGGFSGVETRLDQRGGTPTILSADRLGDDADTNGDGIPDSGISDNADYLCSTTGVGPSAVIDGFVLSGAKIAAIMNRTGSSPTISNCTFRGNLYACVQNESSSPGIVNCTFSENSAPAQGYGYSAYGIVNIAGSSPAIINCTFAVNSNQTAISSDTDCHPTITNSIIWWGNRAAYSIQGGAPIVSHCVIQDGFDNRADIITQDPLLMPLENYGGPTPTMPVYAGSSATNKGVTGAEVPYADQRGFVRDATPDIGACEWQQNFAVIRSGNGANRYAIGSTASLSVVSESALAGATWQWYLGAVGVTSNPIDGATQTRYVTPPLTADTSYWVRGTTPGNPPVSIDAGIALAAYVPTVIYVKPGGTGNGTTSWANATGNLLAAISGAPASAQIWVASGTYTPAIFPISLRSGISIYGGFSGVETQLNDRDIAAHPTILSADTNGNDIDTDGDGVPDSETSDNAANICLNSGADSSAVLDGFILSGAKTVAIMNNGTSSTSGSSPTISNCTFRYNLGNCIQNAYTSSPEISSCTFHHNAPGRVVIRNSGTGSPSVVNCTFDASTSVTTLDIDNQSGSPKVTNCTFALRSNQTAILNAPTSSPTIINSIIWGNANNSGITNNSTSAVVSRCVIQGGFNAGTNIINENPGLLPLANYGGATPTMPVSAGSVAINQGQSGPYADQRGFVRDSAQPDIGACEWQQQGIAAIVTEEGTDRYAIGTSAVLRVISESAQVSGTTRQWYRGAAGDTSNPIAGATLSRYGTPPLTADASYWVRETTPAIPPAPVATRDAGISLAAYAPTVIYVKPGGTGNGTTSWANASGNLTKAISEAPSSAQVWVASGTYTLASNSTDSTIFLRNGISVYGGFSGVETRLDQRDIAAHPTIVTADINGNDADLNGDGVLDPATTSDNADIIIWNIDVGPSAVIDGFILSGGKAMGAAIVNTASSPTIANCTFRYNLGACVGNGGGSSPVIRSCTFHHNAADRVVMVNFGSSPTMVNCTFDVNSPTATAATIYNGPLSDSDLAPSSAKITNCTFAVGGNQTAIYSDLGSNATITNCIIWGNPSSPLGGNATVSNCVLQGASSGHPDIINKDPLLLPLGNYGGPTATMPLYTGSSAIGKGMAGSDIPYADQRGFARDASPDIGACEWKQESAVVETGDGANHYVAGLSAYLRVIFESRELSGIAWQWYLGAVGDTSSPIAGATMSHFMTPPLTQSSSYWARGSFGGLTISSGIALTVDTPNVIFVSTTGYDFMDGRSWQSAKRNLQSALLAAQSGDHIWVATGTYSETISLRDGVSVYGGFAELETRLDQRDVAAHPTILSADTYRNDSDSNGDGIPDSGLSDNAEYICSNTGVGSSALLDGFILSGAGNAAIINYNNYFSTIASSPTIRNCTFRYNPGVCVRNEYSCSPTIDSCTFHHNGLEAVKNMDHSSPTLINCTFISTIDIVTNKQQSSPKIINCTFAVGSTKRAIFSDADCNPAISNSIIWGSSFVTSIQGGAPIVSHCLIQNGFDNRPDIITQDPLLLPLGNYGGPTPTMPLGSGSSAINVGASGSDIPYADQRGFVRDILPDIGACESGVAVAALAGDEPSAPGAIGSMPSVSAHTDKANPTYTWFYGTRGDTSSPVPGGNSQSLVLSPLETGVKVWARITPGDGSAAMDTSERTFEVQGTYDQWCDHHGLTGTERDTKAAVAGDGVGNLLKFALGLRPRDHSSIGDRSTTSFDKPTSKLTQEWRISKTPIGLTIVLEGSNDLKTWSPVSPVLTSQDAGFETWKATLDTAKAAYLRARVIKH